MQIPVLIEPVAASGFRARSGEPLSLTAEGATREEALTKLRQVLECKLQNGSEMVTLQIGSEASPGMRPNSIFANVAQFEEFRGIIEENRRKHAEEKDIHES